MSSGWIDFDLRCQQSRHRALVLPDYYGLAIGDCSLHAEQTVTSTAPASIRHHLVSTGILTRAADDLHRLPVNDQITRRH